VSDASSVEKLKVELEGEKLAPTTVRNRVTEYISKTLKSRQEREPLIGEYVDCAKPEPLHIKNNTVKAIFMKLFKIVVAESSSSKFKYSKDVPANNLLF